MAAMLCDLGLEPDRGELDARKAAGHPIGRPHLAAAAIAANRERLEPVGLAEPSAFLEAYLVPGCPAYCRRETPTVPEAIDAIHGAGGLAVWAHPFWDVWLADDVTEALLRFKDAGLDGVEAFYATHNRDQTELLADLAGEIGLLTTGSADFHGPEHRRFSRFRAFELLRLRAEPRPIAPRGLSLARPTVRARREPSASSASSSLGFSSNDARVRSTRSCPSRSAAARTPRAASSPSCARRSELWASSGAPSTMQATSRSHSPTSARPRSSAAFCARRAARLPRSAASRRMRPWSLEIANSSSSSRPFSTTAAALAPAARACSISAIHGRPPRSPRSAPRATASAAARVAGPAAERQRQRAGGVAEPEPRARVRRLGRDAVAPHPRRDLLRRRRVEAHDLAAAGDRRQHLAGAAREQDQVRERRRLLERLQHPVGGRVVELVGVLDDEDAARGLKRRARGARDDGLVDVADEDPGRAGRRDPREIGVHAVLHAGRRAVRIGGALGQQRGRERPRDGPLSAARRAAEEVGVARRAGGRQRRAEHGARVGVALGTRQHRPRTVPSRACAVGSSRSRASTGPASRRSRPRCATRWPATGR